MFIQNGGTNDLHTNTLTIVVFKYMGLSTHPFLPGVLLLPHRNLAPTPDRGLSGGSSRLESVLLGGGASVLEHHCGHAAAGAPQCGHGRGGFPEWMAPRQPTADGSIQAAHRSVAALFGGRVSRCRSPRGWICGHRSRTAATVPQVPRSAR